MKDFRRHSDENPSPQLDDRVVVREEHSAWVEIEEALQPRSIGGERRFEAVDGGLAWSDPHSDAKSCACRARVTVSSRCRTTSDWCPPVCLGVGIIHTPGRTLLADDLWMTRTREVDEFVGRGAASAGGG